MVKVRFAPSPTGMLHLGGARTALFNWLFARHHHGRYVVRIEDTDMERSTDAAKDAIINGLRWLSLSSDEPIVYQSHHLARHQEVAHTLVDRGMAYRCYATQQEVQALRDTLIATGKPSSHSSRLWRTRTDTKDTPFVIRLKMPLTGETTIHDLVQGPVTVAHEQLDDMVLLRSDGTPTYMLSVVVDDHDMGITHIIRGDDHLNNAFRQYHLFQAMGWSVPHMAHIPLIHGPDGAKMSKRHGAISVQDYQAMGFLPQAMRTYLSRLGWGKGDTDILKDHEAITLFDIQDVGKAPSRFDIEKLKSINAYYLKTMDTKELGDIVRPLLSVDINVDWLERGLPSLVDRAKTLNDIVDQSAMYSHTPPAMTPQAFLKFDDDAKALLERLTVMLDSVTPWRQETLHDAAAVFAAHHRLKLGQVAEPLRLKLTRSTTSPSIFEVMAILGKEETMKRLRSD
jgi:glutamyl-tRNA synthetase